MGNVVGWLNTNKEWISALANVVGIPAAILGLVYTGVQLRDSSRALQAQTMYAIQRDARELVRTFQDPAFVAYLKNQPTATPDAGGKFRWQITEILQFYGAVFAQEEQETLDAAFVRTFTDDFCRFVAEKRAAEIVEALPDTSRIKTKARRCAAARPQG